MNICLNCGKEFQPKKNTKGKYCSRQCSKVAWSKGKKAIFTCPCGKQFERYLSQMSNKEGTQYCSERCFNFYGKRSSFTADQFRFDRENYQFCAPSPQLGDYSTVRIGKTSLAALRNPKYNHYFFKNGITNEVQAYIYGLLLTDGCIQHFPHRNSYRINLKMSDQDIVEQVHLAFESQNPVKVRESKYYEVIFYILAHDLIALGCPPNKTEVANYPLIPDELDRHFIRGVIDGDGSWTTRKRDKSCDLKIYGNDLLLYGIYLKLKQHLGIEPQYLEYPIDHDPNYKMKSYAVMRYSTAKSELIADFIYRDATIYGNRKRDIVLATRAI